MDNPSNISQFRPIALCSVIYKVVTKVIANRLKQLMPMIINPTQSDFLPRRHIIDNFIIT